MIHDGFWQDDLLSIANKIIYWERKINCLIDKGYKYSNTKMENARHKLSQLIFFSACIIRKMIEEENQGISAITKCQDMFPSDEYKDPRRFFKLYNQSIKVRQMPLKDDSVNCFDDYCSEDYDFSTSQKTQYLVKNISNWIIHSYIWSLQNNIQNDNHIRGFVISSDYDRTKFACYVDLKSWCEVLKYFAQNAYL